MAGAASIFFGVLFLFMNGLWLLDYKITGNETQPGGRFWWALYIAFFLGWLVSGWIKSRMPVKVIAEKEIID
jgi:hypothetical protein